MTSHTNIHFVTKNSGELEPFSVEKIIQRLRNLSDISPTCTIDTDMLAIEGANSVIRMHNVPTKIIDETIASMAMAKSSMHSDYSKIAARLIISRHNKINNQPFSDRVEILSSRFSQKYVEFVRKHKDILNSHHDKSRDFLVTFMGFHTMQKQYMLALENTCETPQDVFMRVACHVYGDYSIEHVVKAYDLMSNGYFTHATPTMMNAGRNGANQLASCFLLHCGDSTDEIMQMTTSISKISSQGGGIGLNISSMRNTGAFIGKTGNVSDGIIPLCKLIESTVSLFNQGGRRPGSAAIYLEVHHADIDDFIRMVRRFGGVNIEKTCPKLFSSVWIPDLFMQRFQSNQMWSLFNSKESDILSGLHGEEYNKMYHRFEEQGLAVKQVNPGDILSEIYNTKMMRGFPYIMFKDNVNSVSQQTNTGTIRNSNLCAEIVQYCDSEETAVCNLASVCVSKFLNVEEKTFDYAKLSEVVELIVRGLNHIIDINAYPTECTRRSNLNHRPIGIGIQGLTNVFQRLLIPFGSKEALTLDRNIARCIYKSALLTSARMAKSKYFQTPEHQRDTFCGAYPTFMKQKSKYVNHLRNAKFHYEFYDTTDNPADWKEIRSLIREYGVRNSQLVAYMPTASTSQIFGNNECMEPPTYNLYKRKLNAGEFYVTNADMMNTLQSMNLYTDEVKYELIKSGGSIQHIINIPQNIRDVFKTAYEVDQFDILEHAIIRQPYIDQSMSLNWYYSTSSDPQHIKHNQTQFIEMCMYAWENKLKTCNYYLHSQTFTTATPISIEISPTSSTEEPSDTHQYNDDSTTCFACSS
jgi:ribonucleoside-diphosphate reductase alpha subunit